MLARVEKSQKQDIAERLEASAHESAVLIKAKLVSINETVRGKLDVGEIEALIEAGNLAAVKDKVSEAQDGAYSAMSLALAAALSSAAATATDIAQAMIGDVAFDLFSPALTKDMQDNLNDLVARMIGANEKMADNVLRQVITLGLPASVAAARIVRGIGITAQFEQAIATYEKSLAEGTRAALRRALQDETIDAKTLAAIESGKALTAAQIAALVSAYEGRSRDSRADSVAGDQATGLTNLAQESLWSQAVAAGIVTMVSLKRFWVHMHDARVRDAHRGIPLLNSGGVGMNEPFISSLGPIMRPHDPRASIANTRNCRCFTVIMPSKVV